MYKKNMGEYLKEAKSAVEDAISTGDYRELSDRLGYLAGDAIEEFNQKAGTFCGKNKDRQSHDVPPHAENGQNSQYNGNAGQPAWGVRWYREQKQRWNQRYQREISRTKRNVRTYARTNQVSNDNKRSVYIPKVKVKGRVSSVLYTVFGSLGLTGFGIAAFVLFCVWAGKGYPNGALDMLWKMFGVTTAASAIMLRVGLKRGRFVNRFGIYHSLLMKNRVCEVKRLAEYVNKSEKFVVKELKTMMSYQMFREAHFDDNKAYFMLGDDTYEQYREAQKGYQERQMEQHVEKEHEEEKQADPVVNEELDKAIAEGKAYIEQIRKANDDIPGEEISRKLDRLESLISKIFMCVEMHPEKLPEIRKFMQYYLPITMKLVNVYKEFDSQTIQGDNIKTSKQEIENTLDTIDMAFEKLLDSLYENEAMEVSSDISVLKTLFAQEGLTKKDFDMNK